MTTPIALITDTITQNYLRQCYDCRDAAGCDTEAKCLQCWENKQEAHAEERHEPLALTAWFLQLQYD